VFDRAQSTNVLTRSRSGLSPLTIVLALAAFIGGLALGDNIVTHEPPGQLPISRLHDLVDVGLFAAVALAVGVLIARVVRDRARAEALAARERQAREERDRLISIISHDIGTPLNAIRGTVQFARHSGRAVGVDMERLLARVDIAAARASSLIRTLSDVKALETGDLSLQLRAIDLRECLGTVVRMLECASDRHPITLRAPRRAVQVNADRERLQQVFENLISNAIKYSPHGGSIEVTLADEDRASAVIQVRDHGIGLPAGAANRVFERAYRAPNAIGVAGGLGLGLTISAEIIRRHGGSIDAQPAPPAGAVFTVRLPRLAVTHAPQVRCITLIDVTR
jgi:signal transduction histidine kinase